MRHDMKEVPCNSLFGRVILMRDVERNLKVSIKFTEKGIKKKSPIIEKTEKEDSPFVIKCKGWKF